jgi:hypothetical protein
MQSRVLSDAARGGVRRARTTCFAALACGAAIALVSPATAAANPSADIDQCANGPIGAPVTCTTAGPGGAWGNGNVNSTKGHYLEGDSMPYRIVFGDLATGAPVHTISITWDTSKGGAHAFDYLTTYTASEAPANACAGVTGCSGFPVDTEPVPVDPLVAAGPDGVAGNGDDVTPLAGNFTLYGGNITAVSAYSHSGTFAGDSSASITISFTTTVANPVLAWGGHISRRLDWGQGAVNISGSSYHTGVGDLDGSGGSQDLQLASDAVIFPAHITITKVTSPASNAQDFAFTATGTGMSDFSLDTDSGDATLPDSKSFDVTVFDDKVITEAPVTGWSLTALSCTEDGKQDSTTSLLTGAATLKVSEAETISCTFTNSAVAPKLIVNKVVVNDNGGVATPASFTMNVTGNGPSPASFAGQNTPGRTVDIGPGSYSVGESGPSGYGASFSADCSGTIAFGETKTCTVTNDDQAGTLIVEKVVTNDNGGTATPGDFTMSVTGTGVSDPSFPGQNTPGKTVTLHAGSYSVGESGPSGYGASFSADCSGTIANGETRTCTIVNDDQAATLIVEKVVTNDDGGTATPGDFTMTVTGADPSPASFAGQNTPGRSVTLDAGSYSVGESGPSGYTQTSNDPDCAGTIANGQTRTCTIVNDDDAPHLIVNKVVVTDNGGTATPASFTMSVTGASPSPASFPGQNTPGRSVTLNAGSYSVGESGPTGYAADFSTDCTGTIALGQTKTCTVTNDDIAPTLTVNKVIVGEPNDPGLFNLRIDGATAGTGANAGDGGTTGAVPVSAGGHTVGESAGNATTLSDYIGAISGDCAANGSVTLALGEAKTCTITNTRKAHVTVVKTDNGGAPNLQHQFTLTGGPGNVSLSKTTLVDDTPPGSGTLDFGLLAPGSYTLCEINVPAGVTSSLQSLPGATVNTTTGDVCAPITLTAGQELLLNVDNRRPLGGQRTIGYWKNWNTCSKTAAQKIANAAKTGNLLVDQLLPQTLGNVSVTTCRKAVEILSEASMKYAEHGLAAQLLAAKLNKAAAGGIVCPAAATAIGQGDALLIQIGWNGGVGTKIVASDHALRSQFTTTAAALDQFNNGLLCP